MINNRDQAVDYATTRHCKDSWGMSAKNLSRRGPPPPPTLSLSLSLSLSRGRGKAYKEGKLGSSNSSISSSGEGGGGGGELSSRATWVHGSLPLWSNATDNGGSKGGELRPVRTRNPAKTASTFLLLGQFIQTSTPMSLHLVSLSKGFSYLL